MKNINIYTDSIYPMTRPTVEINKKPIFLGNHDLLQHNSKAFERMNYMTIESNGKTFSIMSCNEAGIITDIYSVIRKGFRTYEKAKQYFNKYFRNITLVEKDVIK